MTEHALSLTDVSRTYRGGAGVQQIDLSVRRGEIHALVGLNGAGKSTLMKLMVGMLRPTSGRIEVLGRSAAEADPATWSRVGALLEYPLIYGELDGRTNLQLATRLRGVPATQRGPMVEAILAELDLGRYASVSRSAPVAGEPAAAGVGRSLAAPARPDHPRRADQCPRPIGRDPAARGVTAEGGGRRRDPGLQPPSRRGGQDRHPDLRHRGGTDGRHPRPRPH